MNRCQSHQTMHRLALAVHGGVGVLNILIAGYNWLQGNRKRATFHAALAVYEGFAVADHTEDAR